MKRKSKIITATVGILIVILLCGVIAMCARRAEPTPAPQEHRSPGSIEFNVQALEF